VSTAQEQVEIRFATSADAALLLEMIRELAAFEQLTHDVSATEEKLRETLLNPGGYAHALLAFARDEPAGFAVYFFSYSTFGAKPVLYLEDLFVRLPFRKRGFGQQLFTYVVGIAAQEGCSRVDWSVLDWNSEAMAFYERQGARAYREWIKFSLQKDQFKVPIPSCRSN